MEHANDNTRILMGAAAIAAHLGITRRQAYKLAYSDGMPVMKLGGTVAARPHDIEDWLAAKATSARAVA
jgi:hypothetical protein